MKDFDLVIIGGGPGGLVAGLYATRSGLRTILVDKYVIGGQVITTDRIENYPGFLEPVSGVELIEKMRKQAEGFGLIIKEFCEVTSLETGNGFTLSSANGESLHAWSLIIATGAAPKMLDVPGAERLQGRGISYCAVCDGPFFRNQPVLVMGGGNAAIEEALYLTRFASKVYIVHRRDRLRADEVLQERALKEERIQILWNTVIHEVVGEVRLEKAVVENIQTRELSELEVAGLFVYIGTIPNTGLLKGIADLDDQGYVFTDSSMATSCPGIFAVGDCRHKRIRQIVTSVGEGATAAMMAYHYLQETRGGNL